MSEKCTLEKMPWFRYWSHKYTKLIEICSVEERSDILLAITRYATGRIDLPELSGLSEAVFVLMRDDVDASFDAYKKQVEAGKRGGRPQKTHPNPP